MSTVHHIPAGFHSLQPAINVDDVDGLIAFLQTVFAAEMLDHYRMPDGSTIHAEYQIGNTLLILGPSLTEGPFPAKVFVYVPTVDETYALALQNGATSVTEPADQFFGQRVGRVKDQWGNLWVIATQTEVVSRAEAKQRFKAMFT